MRVGDRVSWAWGAHRGEGRIAERFTRKVSRTIKGAKVVRDASAAEPAYLIEQDDGDRVLKSESELTKVVHN
jgi:hypothetical protein